MIIIFILRPPVILQMNATLADSISALVGNNVHHVWVTNADAVPVAVISHSSLLAVLTKSEGTPTLQLPSS